MYPRTSTHASHIISSGCQVAGLRIHPGGKSHSELLKMVMNTQAICLSLDNEGYGFFQISYLSFINFIVKFPYFQYLSI